MQLPLLRPRGVGGSAAEGGLGPPPTSLSPAPPPPRSEASLSGVYPTTPGLLSCLPARTPGTRAEPQETPAGALQSGARGVLTGYPKPPPSVKRQHKDAKPQNSYFNLPVNQQPPSHPTRLTRPMPTHNARIVLSLRKGAWPCTSPYDNVTIVSDPRVTSMCSRHVRSTRSPRVYAAMKSTKAQGPLCFSCPGLAWGQQRTGAARKDSEKHHRNAAFKAMTALLSPSF